MLLSAKLKDKSMQMEEAYFESLATLKYILSKQTQQDHIMQIVFNTIHHLFSCSTGQKWTAQTKAPK